MRSQGQEKPLFVRIAHDSVSDPVFSKIIARARHCLFPSQFGDSHGKRRIHSHENEDCLHHSYIGKTPKGS